MNVNEFAFSRGVEFATQLFRVNYVYKASNGLVEYMGITHRGSALADASWLVFKFVYDANDSVTDIITSPPNQVMNNYASLTYPLT